MKIISLEEKTWTQPIISSNGVLGSDVFACSSSFNQSGYPAYYAFDGVSSTYYSTYENNNGNTCTIYSNTPIKVTGMTFTWLTTKSRSEFSTTTFYGSNDGANWVALESTWDNDTVATISNATFYKYYKFYQKYYFCIYNLKITATYMDGMDPLNNAWASPSESCYAIKY